MTTMPLPWKPSGGVSPSWARKGAFCTPRNSDVSGFVMRWQRSQVTPSTSPAPRPEPSVGVELPPSQPVGVWQRRQRSPEPAKSCSATATVAQKSGSRVAWDMRLPRQPWAGSTTGS